MKTSTLFSALFILSTTGLFAQPGSLDMGFDGDGKVITAMGSSDETAVSIVEQPDGKVILAGYSYNGSDNDFALARYNTNGSLDNSFSTDGKLIMSIGSGDDNAYAVALQPDGKLVVAGLYDNGTDIDLVLARLNPNGTPDNSFNSNGIVTASFGSAFDEATAVAIQPDGKIVVAGWSYIISDYDFAVARFNADGSLDNTFSGDGKHTIDFNLTDDLANSMRVLPNGNILIAGRHYNGADDDFALACLTPQGTLLSGFGSNGRVITDFGSGGDIANSVFDILENGKIVVAGSAYNGANRDFVLARYNSDGSLDNSFNSVGYVTKALGSSDDDAHSVCPQPDGKLVLSGCTYNGSDWDFALCRYNTDGTIDNTFGTNGVVTTAIGSYQDGVNAAVMVPGGYIFLTGYATNGTDADFALAKYYLWTPTSVINLSGSANQVWIYPNPIKQEATLEYSLNKEENISVRLLDMQGRVLQTYIDNEKQNMGKHKLTFFLPEGLPSGNYLLTISSLKGLASIKIVK